jgi:hypothetical protein
VLRDLTAYKLPFSAGFLRHDAFFYKVAWPMSRDRSPAFPPSLKKKKKFRESSFWRGGRVKRMGFLIFAFPTNYLPIQTARDFWSFALALVRKAPNQCCLLTLDIEEAEVQAVITNSYFFIRSVIALAGSV